LIILGDAMKNFLCVFLSSLITFTSFSCSSKKSGKKASTQEVKKEEVKATDEAMTQENNNQNTNTTTDTSKSKFDLTQANALIEDLLKSSDLLIKDYDGGDVSVEKYRSNPSDYYLIFKQNAESSVYNVLHTSIGSGIISAVIKSKLDLTYKIYQLPGAMSDFKGADLGAPKYSETLSLDLEFKNLKENQEKFKAFFDKLNDLELAGNTSIFQKISNVLFPTAYAATANFDTKDIKTIAIIFSSVSLIAYVIAIYHGNFGGMAHNLGLFTGAVGLTFWLLYWIAD
jgi:hypothetical protein